MSLHFLRNNELAHDSFITVKKTNFILMKIKLL